MQVEPARGKPLDIHWCEYALNNSTTFTTILQLSTTIHFKGKAKDTIESDVRIKVLEPVGMVFRLYGKQQYWLWRNVANSDGLLTIKSSTKPQNEKNITPSPFHLVSLVPSNMLKTLFDVWNGYHALQLTEKAKNALMFITKFGW